MVAQPWPSAITSSCKTFTGRWYVIDLDPCRHIMAACKSANDSLQHSYQTVWAYDICPNLPTCHTADAKNLAHSGGLLQQWWIRADRRYHDLRWQYAQCIRASSAAHVVGIAFPKACQHTMWHMGERSWCRKKRLGPGSKNHCHGHLHGRHQQCWWKPLRTGNPQDLTPYCGGL